MKFMHSFYRFFIFVAMTLSICHPGMQLRAQALTTNSEPYVLAGELENGMNFAILSSDKLKGGVWVRLTCSIPEDEMNDQVSMLIQHALFYGSEKYTREDLAAKLNSLGLDIDADSYIQSNKQEKSLQFGLQNPSLEQLKESLDLLKQMAFHATLDITGLELAKNHLLSKLDQDEDRLAVQTTTVAEAQELYAKWYRPENMQFTIIGYNNPDELLSIIAQAFDSNVAKNEKIHLKLPSPDLDSPFLESIEWTSDNNFLLVDGKILMDEPDWINSSQNGQALGLLLTVVGIGGLILSLPVTGPFLIVASSLSAASGIYFMNCDYLKDPIYVESIRKTDLQKGCTYAYSRGRAGITMTPYERRASFLQEMVDHPHTLPKLPILLLADLYQLNDPIIAELFTVDEFNVLSRLKRDFIQQRNEMKMLQENLEKELLTLTAPYLKARDLSLVRAKNTYNQNYYVVAKASYKAQYRAYVADVEKSFKNLQIILEEKERLIKQAKETYEVSISTPEFKAGLLAAELNLAQASLEIEAAYKLQVEVVKQTIQYNQRMDYFRQGEKAGVNYFNSELHKLLATFPTYYTPCRDFLDLRNR